MGRTQVRNRRSLTCGSHAGEVGLTAAGGCQPQSAGAQRQRRSVFWRQQGGRDTFEHKNDKISAISATCVLCWGQRGQKGKSRVGSSRCADSGGEASETGCLSFFGEISCSPNWPAVYQVAFYENQPSRDVSK